MSNDSEICRIRSGGASGPCRARATAARHPYSAFAEIFIEPIVPGQLGADTSKLTAIQGVQPTLGLRLTGPPARAFVLARGHRPGARPAANRRLALVMQRVVRH